MKRARNLSPEEELRTAWGELSNAWRRFDEAADPELVESCVYRINAEKALCDYLFRTVKRRCTNGDFSDILSYRQ